MNRNNKFNKDKFHSVVIEARKKFEYIRDNNGFVSENKYMELCIL